MLDKLVSGWFELTPTVETTSSVALVCPLKLMSR